MRSRISLSRRAGARRLEGRAAPIGNLIATPARPGPSLTLGMTVVLLFLACNKHDPQQQAKSARSWQATIDVVSKAMHERKVSPRYAKQVAEAAEKELQKSGGEGAAAPLSAAGKLREECERR